MTYCVGLRLNKAIIFMSDTRTNAGVDNFSKTPKMFTWSVKGERSITLMTAGNLATTQALVSLLEERSKAVEERNPTILKEPSMFQVARLVGNTLKEVIGDTVNKDELTASSKFKATLILGGQIKGGPPTLFLIYPEGNFIEVTDETPFFQIGETKYGRPILVRAYDPDMKFEDAIKLLIVSFDSTMKANLSVGMPLDFHIYENDTYETGLVKRIEDTDELYKVISSSWGDALKTAFKSLPSYEI